MANMVECVKCQSPMAKSADECPKCRYPVPRNVAHCRLCKEFLARHRHRYVGYSASTVVVNGNSVGGSSFWVHIPCPHCGEKKPLRKFTETFVGKLAFVGAIVIPGAILYYVFSAIADHKAAEASGPKFGPTPTQIANSEKRKKLADMLHSGKKVTMVTTADFVVKDQERVLCTVSKGERVAVNKDFLMMVAQDVWAVQGYFSDLCPGSAEQEPRDDRHVRTFQAENPKVE
jgi:hypothetical protein